MIRRVLKAPTALSLALFAVLTCAGPAFAQAPADAPTADAPAADAAGSTTKPGKDVFKAAKLEALRYRHLWIAYGAIWLIIFVFVWRTWRRGNETASELDTLRKRLADLEKRNG